MLSGTLTNDRSSGNSLLLDGEVPATLGAAAGFLCPAGAISKPKRRHGAPARKEGKRHKNGKLKYKPAQDLGNEAARARRIALVGEDKARQQKAGWSLGVLELRGYLADPGLTGIEAETQAADRYLAGEQFVADHVRVFGLQTPKAVDLLNGRAGRGEAGEATEADQKVFARYSRKSAAVRKLMRGGMIAFPILVRVTVGDEFPQSEPEMAALRGALAVLVQHRREF